MKKKSGYKSMRSEKICNICGELCLVYSVIDNGVYCEDCKPTKSKRIMSESQMLKLMLNQKPQTIIQEVYNE
jgi:hypothetical protein